MTRFFILVLWCWSTIASALHVSEQSNWLTGLQQPVALSWSEKTGILGVLDGSGLTFYTPDGIKQNTVATRHRAGYFCLSRSMAGGESTK
jgi:hypothetical protein